MCCPSRHRSSFSRRCLWANICPVNSGNFNYLWITQLSTVQSLQECPPVLFLQTSSIKTRSRPLRPQVIDGSVKFINRVSWYLAGCGLRAKKYISFHSSLTSRWLALRALPRRESGLCLAWWVNFPQFARKVISIATWNHAKCAEVEVIRRSSKFCRDAAKSRSSVGVANLSVFTWTADVPSKWEAGNVTLTNITVYDQICLLLKRVTRRTSSNLP